MKILKIKKKSYEEIEVDTGRERIRCRRFGPNEWLYRLGLSWEEPGELDELEEAYQARKKKGWFGG